MICEVLSFLSGSLKLTVPYLQEIRGLDWLRLSPN